MNKKILYFGSGWCGPCKMMGPIMESLNSQINYQKIDVDNQSDLANQYNIRNIPTLVLLENGMEKNRVSGLQNKEQILNFYNG